MPKNFSQDSRVQQDVYISHSRWGSPKEFGENRPRRPPYSGALPVAFQGGAVERDERKRFVKQYLNLMSHGSF